MFRYDHLLIVASVAVCSAVHADTVYVDDDNCPGPGDGSELNPYCSIQTAIDNAVDTDEIIVAPGTYFETIDFMGKAVWLHSSDGPEMTIIDGAGDFHVVQCVSGEGQETVLGGITITGGNANGIGGPPSYDGAGGGMSNIGASPTVNNCIFAGNTANGGGGGMANFQAACPTITDCSFEGNVVADGIGGGMHNWTNSNPTVTNCTFAANSADAGGGMFNEADSSPTLTDCAFSGNTATFSGGGIRSLDSSPTITNCTFTDNSAGQTGGAIITSGTLDSSPTVTNCTFTDNSASQGGGGMVISGDLMVTDCAFVGNSTGLHGGGIRIEGNPTVTNCTFTNNYASSLGGGITNVGSPTVSNCRFNDNTASSGGGGMMNSFGGSPALINCRFNQNSAGLGGGMADAGDATLTDCTFSGNSAGINGGGMWSGGQAMVNNCILWSNTPNEIFNTILATTLVSYSDVQGSGGSDAWDSSVGTDGGGNIDADPMFVDPDNGDFRLSPGSPCIDAADNTAVPEGIDTDLDGNPRFLEIPETPDTGYGDLPIVDMGAFESLGGGCLAITSQELICHGDGSTFTVNVEGLDACTGGTTMVTFTGSGGAVGEDFCATLIVNSGEGGFCCSTQVCVPVPDCSGSAIPCDLDGDGVVGVLDFLVLLGAWGPNPIHPADFDGDGDVGVTDLLIVLANWG